MTAGRSREASLGLLTTTELLYLRQAGEAVAADLVALADALAVAEVEPARPGLAGRRAEAFRLLHTPLHDLARDLLATARGVTRTQAAVAPARGEELAALLHLGLGSEDAGHQFDRAVAPAWDAHLQRWERRHHEVVDRLVADLGLAGRAAALAELGLEDAPVVPQAAGAWALLPRRFEGVGRALAADLRGGTGRSAGVNALVGDPRTVGAAALHLRRLCDAVCPALEVLAGQVTWTAYAEGYRLGAIDGTHARLAAAGVVPTVGVPLTAAGVPAEVLATLPRYRWSGPQDAETCGACADRKRQVVLALGLDEMPCCQDVCAHGDYCRHFWNLVTSPGS